MLTACGTTAEKRSSNITTDVVFIHAASDASCGRLWIIHETNFRQVELVNKNLKQIRDGAKW